MKNIAEYILEALKQYHKDYDEVGLAMLDYVEGTTTNELQSPWGKSWND